MTYLNSFRLSGIREIFDSSGKLTTDFIANSGIGATLINMKLNVKLNNKIIHTLLMASGLSLQMVWYPEDLKPQNPYGQNITREVVLTVKILNDHGVLLTYLWRKDGLYRKAIKTLYSRGNPRLTLPVTEVRI